MGSRCDIYIWVTIIMSVGKMSVEILARERGFPLKGRVNVGFLG
jgi:hypothetical protein